MLFISIGKKIKVSFWVVVWVALLVIFSQWQAGMIFYATAILHEFAHVFAMKMMNIRIKKICFLPFGLTVQTVESSIKNPQKEFWTALCGPLSNAAMLLVAAVLQRKFNAGSELLQLFILANTMMFSVNILPILPLDGGRMLRSYLTPDWGNLAAFNFVQKISKLFCVLLAIFGIVALLFFHFNFSILILCGFLLFSLAEESQCNSLIFMREIAFSKEKLCKEGMLKANIVACTAEYRISKIIKKLCYNQFCIVKIFDRFGHKLGEFSETELIEFLAHNSFESCVGDILRSHISFEKSDM